jgi:hypothetical protein
MTQYRVLRSYTVTEIYELEADDPDTAAQRVEQDGAGFVKSYDGEYESTEVETVNG